MYKLTSASKMGLMFLISFMLSMSMALATTLTPFSTTSVIENEVYIAGDYEVTVVSISDTANHVKFNVDNKDTTVIKGNSLNLGDYEIKVLSIDSTSAATIQYNKILKQETASSLEEAKKEFENNLDYRVLKDGDQADYKGIVIKVSSIDVSDDEAKIRVDGNSIRLKEGESETVNNLKVTLKEVHEGKDVEPGVTLYFEELGEISAKDPDGELKIGEEHIVNGKTIKITSIGKDFVSISVSNLHATIYEGQSKSIGSLKITADKVNFDEKNWQERSAKLSFDQVTLTDINDGSLSIGQATTAEGKDLTVLSIGKDVAVVNVDGETKSVYKGRSSVFDKKGIEVSISSLDFEKDWKERNVVLAVRKSNIVTSKKTEASSKPSGSMGIGDTISYNDKTIKVIAVTETRALISVGNSKGFIYNEKTGTIGGVSITVDELSFDKNDWESRNVKLEVSGVSDTTTTTNKETDKSKTSSSDGVTGALTAGCSYGLATSTTPVKYENINVYVTKTSVGTGSHSGSTQIKITDSSGKTVIEDEIEKGVDSLTGIERDRLLTQTSGIGRYVLSINGEARRILVFPHKTQSLRGSGTQADIIVGEDIFQCAQSAVPGKSGSTDSLTGFSMNKIKLTYERGENVEVTGTLSPSLFARTGQTVTFQVFSGDVNPRDPKGGKLVEIGQVMVDSSGTWDWKFVADGSLKPAGEYTVIANALGGNGVDMVLSQKITIK